MKKERKKLIIPPECGWQEHSIYIVEVAWNPNNPIHKAILHTGFIKDGNFGGYCEVWCNNYEYGYHASDAYILKFNKYLGTLK